MFKNFRALNRHLKSLNTIFGVFRTNQLLSDNKSVTQFFQTKILPGNPWIAVDYVLLFNITLGRIPVKANAASDYLLRVQVSPATKMKLNQPMEYP